MFYICIYGFKNCLCLLHNSIQLNSQTHLLFVLPYPIILNHCQTLASRYFGKKIPLKMYWKLNFQKSSFPINISNFELPTFCGLKWKHQKNNTVLMSYAEFSILKIYFQFLDPLLFLKWTKKIESNWANC